MTPFEERIWTTALGALLAQRGWPISFTDMSDAITLADSAVLGVRGRVKRSGRLHEDDSLAAERLARQPYQPPEGAVDLATKLRDRLVATGDAVVHRGDIMPLLDMLIGASEDDGSHKMKEVIPGVTVVTASHK